MKKIIFLAIFTVISCTQVADFEEIKLTKPTMVSIAPDSTSIDLLQSKWGEEDFYVIIDDILWYHSELMILVDSLDIAQVNTEKRRVTISGNKKQWSIDTDTTENKWRYIYFDGETFLETDAINMRDLLSTN